MSQNCVIYLLFIALFRKEHTRTRRERGRKGSDRDAEENELTRVDSSFISDTKLAKKKEKRTDFRMNNKEIFDQSQKRTSMIVRVKHNQCTKKDQT